MKINLFDAILRPSITEKVTKDQETLGKYAFEVHPQANKNQIRSSIEKIYNVHVLRVNTINRPGKWRRVRREAGKTASWKRAIVTLKKGEKIDITTQ